MKRLFQWVNRAISLFISLAFVSAGITLLGAESINTIRINAGGPGYVDSEGKTWGADHGYNTAHVASTPTTVTGTSAPQLFKTERYDLAASPALAYTFNLPNGSYSVRLHFAETYGPSKGPGLRVFSVDLQGSRTFQDVDIFVQAGGADRALVLQSPATITNGQLTISFVNQVSNPKINAIEIIATDPPSPPTAPGNLNFTEVTSGGVTLNWTAAADDVSVAGYRIFRNGTAIGTVAELSYMDFGLRAGTPYIYSVETLDNAGNPSTVISNEITTLSGANPGILRINAGGSGFMDPVGDSWGNGGGYNLASTVVTTTIVSGTVVPELFTSARVGMYATLAYTFNVPDGTYVVRLYFAETRGVNKGRELRVFSVDIQGNPALQDIDVFTQAGGADRALALQSVATVSNGQLSIVFVRQISDPLVNAIEIIPADNEAPTVAGNLSFSGVTSKDVTLNWTAGGDNLGVTGYRILRNGTAVAIVAGLSYTDTGLNAGTAYVYSVETLDAANNASVGISNTITTLAGGNPGILRINAGGLAQADPAGISWGNGLGYNTASNVTTTATVTGTLTPELFKTSKAGMYAPLGYTLNVPNGTYVVRLHFAETDGKHKGPGLRVFSVDMQGTRTLNNVDIFAQAGGADRALALDSVATVTNGQLVIGFDDYISAPILNALEVIPADNEVPTAPGDVSFSGVTSEGVTLNWTAGADNLGVSGYRILRNGTAVATVAGLSYTEIGLTAGTAYTYSVETLDAANNASVATSNTISTLAGGTPGILRINAGGLAHADPAGNSWGNGLGYNTASNMTTTATVTGTMTPELFKTSKAGMYAPLGYTLNVPNGTYVVRLYFAETDGRHKGPGLRVFSVDMQGARTLSNVDIFARAGGADRALALDSVATVTNGQLVIGFDDHISAPILNALEIIPADNEVPTAAGNVSFSGVTSKGVTLNWTAGTDNLGVTGYRILRNGTAIGRVSGLSYTDIGLSAGTSYIYSVETLDAANNASVAVSNTATTLAGGNPSIVRINAGGPAHTDPAGQSWAADYGNHGGSQITTTATVTGTFAPQLFKSDRSGIYAPLAYTFNVPNGAYVVRLHFAETSAHAKGLGMRVFSVDVQGSPALQDVDVFTLAGGGDRALALHSTATVTNGQLTIAFFRRVSDPKVNAIEIIPVDSQGPTSPGNLTFSGVTSTAVTLNWTAAADNFDVIGYRIVRNGSTVATVTGLSYADIGLAADTAYLYSVLAIDAAENVSPPVSSTISTAAAGTAPSFIRINAGGPAYVDLLGRAWSADYGYTGGSLASGTPVVSDTTAPKLFHTVRYSNHSYNLPVVNGDYTVRLHLHDSQQNATWGVGSRIFDINIEAVRAFEDVDPIALAGGFNKAVVLEKTTSVSDGILNLQFINQVSVATTFGIEVIPISGGDFTPPSAPGQLDFSNVGTSSVTLSWVAATDNVGVTGYRISRGGTVLPTSSGLSVTDTGLIAGTSYTYSVVALDAAGNYSAATSGSITTSTGGGAISSPLAAIGKAGAAFNYQISADNNPTSYSAEGLPAGLSVDQLTGLISGIPANPGTSTVTISATNGSETVSATIEITILATLPYTADFETAEGYNATGLDGQLGWTVDQGAASITTQNQANGTQSVELNAGSSRAVVTQLFADDSGETVEFFDFFAKPVAHADISSATIFEVEGAKFAFNSNGFQGGLHFFDSNTPGGGAWIPTGFVVPVDANHQTLDWVRLTARLDFTRQIWDLYANGFMVAADIPTIAGNAYLSKFQATGSVATSSLLDDIYAGSINPLFADSNSNGIDDAWETSHGLPLTSDNRATSPSGNGVTVVQAYVEGTDPNDFFSGDVPTLAIVGGNDQVAPVGHFNPLPLDVAVWKTTGMVPLTNAPVTFSVTQGGGTLAISTSGTPVLASSVTLRTDIDGTAQVFYQQPSTSGVVSQITAAAGTAQIIFGSTSSTASTGAEDSDEDGLSDDWEEQYLGTLSYGASDDPGNVGRTLLQSFEQGLSPVSAASVSGGLRAWYRANAGVTKDQAGRVSKWSDRSGHGFHVSQPLSASMPIWESSSFNGKPAINFGGLSMMKTALADLHAGSSDLTVIAVIRPSPTQMESAMILDFNRSGSAEGFSMEQNAAATNEYRLSWLNAARDTWQGNGQAVTPATASPQIVAFIKNGSVHESFLNGVVAASGPVDSLMWTPVTELAIGARVGSGAGFNGEIAEILIYNRALSIEERTTIFSGLAQTYTESSTEAQLLVAGGDSVIWQDETGAVRTWGSNRYGALGDGSLISRFQMREPTGISGPLSGAAVGASHALAITAAGEVYAWGDNYFGQLGTGGTILHQTAVAVPGLSDIVQVAVGDAHSLALKADGTVWAWGANQSGQLGDGTKTKQSVPAQIIGLTDAVHIVAGARHSAALTADGFVWIWGSNEFGQLADPLVQDRLVPTKLSALTGVSSLASGRHHLIALRTEGTVWGWGDNHAGQLGIGNAVGQVIPQLITTTSSIASITAGANHSAALCVDGTLLAWGANQVGQLGDGTTGSTVLPLPLTLTNVQAIASGRDHLVILKVDGSLQSWGLNDQGQLGRPTAGLFSNEPMNVSPAEVEP